MQAERVESTTSITQHGPATPRALQPWCPQRSCTPGLGQLAARYSAGCHLPVGIWELCHPVQLCAFLHASPTGRRAPGLTCWGFFQ